MDPGPKINNRSSHESPEVVEKRDSSAEAQFTQHKPPPDLRKEANVSTLVKGDAEVDPRIIAAQGEDPAPSGGYQQDYLTCKQMDPNGADFGNVQRSYRAAG